MAENEKNVVDDVTKVYDSQVGISVTNVVGESSTDADLSDDVDIVIGDTRPLCERLRDRNINTNHKMNSKERVEGTPGRSNSEECLLKKGVFKTDNGMDPLGFIFPSRLFKCDARLSGSTPCILEKKDDLKSDKDRLSLGKFEKAKSRSQELKIQNRFDMSPTSSSKRFIPLLTEGVAQVCQLSKKETKIFDDLKYRYLKWEQHYLLLENDCIKSAKVKHLYKYYNSIFQTHYFNVPGGIKAKVL